MSSLGRLALASRAASRSALAWPGPTAGYLRRKCQRWPLVLRREHSSSADALWNADAWPSHSVRLALQHAAEAGSLPETMLVKLRGEATEVEGADEVAPPTKAALALADLALVADLCSARRVRDFVWLSRMATRIVPQLEKAPAEVLLKLCSAYANMGALNVPLFEAIAVELMKQTLKDASSAAPVSQLTEIARCFALQRMRHRPLFGQLFQHLDAQGGASAASPTEALILLRSISSLRLDGESSLWHGLEQQVVSSGVGNLAPLVAADLCHALFVSRRDSERLDFVLELLHAVSSHINSAEDAYWSSQDGRRLHHRALLLRSALRYLHQTEYKSLPEEVASALRLMHRKDPPLQEAKPSVNFVRKLSHVLTKLKIGHLCNADRGPLVLDVVERDRKLVYECNHFDRFYAGTVEKIAERCLQERIVKAMGYRVVQIPHWQWNKLHRLRQRTEYIRMSRYYAIKDRRETSLRDEVPGDVAVSDMDYMGEYFFRKESPSSSWSWFSPRYDAKRRLPGHAPVAT